MVRPLQLPFIARRRTSTIAPTALACVALMLAASVGGSFQRWLARDHGPREFDGFRQVRIKTIQAQLDQVEGPYIVIMGDSHAERLYLSSLCGLPVVNAGMSGATLGDVLDLSRAITPRRKASALLLSVGTNDIWVKRAPETDHAENVFRAGLAALKARLVMWTDHRALAAIPPVASHQEKQFPRAAAERYSGMLARSCEPRSCIYLDLFAEAQRPTGPRSAFSDGVHLRDYAGFVRARERELCLGLGLESRT
ncbi:SGNH/GDSL hydrolase family protein [Bosea sp. CS1GBMeth4]|uniref:SGNH/GDSL hydrolase family protein n=1 Tax=Bosea sp. CS1GBMeth4 TaxID=1892849 RepID=UPI001644EE41|nr:SGNH/GDSL hydrolase family protein [Bosea sp. CS1GBMeth4]